MGLNLKLALHIKSMNGSMNKSLKDYGGIEEWKLLVETVNKVDGLQISGVNITYIYNDCGNTQKDHQYLYKLKNKYINNHIKF